MKKLALISTFCNTPKKQALLEDNIDQLHELGIDTLIFTPKNILPFKIIEKATHCIITKENPIPPLSEKMRFNWMTPPSKLDIRYQLINLDYSWASINQFKRLLNYGSNLGYDLLYPMIYDIKITPELKGIINSNISNHFFSNIRPGKKHFFKVSYIFGSFTPEIAQKISQRFTRQEFYTYSSAERYLAQIQQDLNLPIHDYVIEDLHFEHMADSYFNVSPDKNLSLFIDTTRVFKNSNFTESKNEIALHFSNVLQPSEVIINNLKFTIEEEKILFFKLDSITLNITINGYDVDIKSILDFPIREIKLNDNNKWAYLKGSKISNIIY